MGIEPGARFVAHYDMLGMSALVQRDLPKALSAIRQLDDARERILGLTIEPEFGVMRLYEIVTRTLFPLI